MFLGEGGPSQKPRAEARGKGVEWGWETECEIHKESMHCGKKKAQKKSIMHLASIFFFKFVWFCMERIKFKGFLIQREKYIHVSDKPKNAKLCKMR